MKNSKMIREKNDTQESKKWEIRYKKLVLGPGCQNVL